jgi:hypothetical protein
VFKSFLSKNCFFAIVFLRSQKTIITPINPEFCRFGHCPWGKWHMGQWHWGNPPGVHCLQFAKKFKNFLLRSILGYIFCYISNFKWIFLQIRDDLPQGIGFNPTKFGVNRRQLSFLRKSLNLLRKNNFRNQSRCGQKTRFLPYKAKKSANFRFC